MKRIVLSVCLLSFLVFSIPVQCHAEGKASGRNYSLMEWVVQSAPIILGFCFGRIGITLVKKKLNTNH